MTTRQNQLTNHLYQALTETQLDQIQGGGSIPPNVPSTRPKKFKIKEPFDPGDL